MILRDLSENSLTGVIMGGKRTILLWSYILNTCQCISLDQLFPYGLQFGDSPLLQGMNTGTRLVDSINFTGEGMDDATSTEVHLNVPLNFFQREYLSLFVSLLLIIIKLIFNVKVNENGLVSFLTEISTFYSVQVRILSCD